MSEYTDLAVDYADRGSQESAARLAQVGQAVESERIATALERIADVLETKQPKVIENVTVINPVTKLEAMTARQKYDYIKQIKGATTLSEAEAILIDLWDLATS